MTNYFDQKQLDLRRAGIEIQFNGHLIETLKRYETTISELKDEVHLKKIKIKELEKKIDFLTNTPTIDDLGLTVRTAKRLKVMFNGETNIPITKLSEYSTSDFLFVPGFGRKSVNELRDVLFEYGVLLKDYRS
jgi:DNA-directed RNA polymerase alpha subunit